RDIRYLKQPVVDLTASSTVLKPCGRAISTPETKLGCTFPGPKTSTASHIQRTQLSQPTRSALPGLIHSKSRLSHTSMLKWMLSAPAALYRSTSARGRALTSKVILGLAELFLMARM